MYSYLSQHPQLLPSIHKAVHFFDGGLDESADNFEKGEAWYRAHFQLRMHAHERTFEASPLYIFNPLAPKRIYDLVPEAKIIAVLRNPTERAISQYFHEKGGKNRDPLSIREALREEETRLKAAVRAKDYKNDSFIHHSYKSRGLYKVQLERYLNYFPREQILVLCSEEFFAETENTLRPVFEFVGVDSAFRVQDLKPRKVNADKGDVAPEIYEYLDSYCLPHNQMLYELIGRSYPW